MACMRKSENTLWESFSPSTMWVLGTELWSSGLATSIFINCTFSLAYYYYVHAILSLSNRSANFGSFRQYQIDCIQVCENVTRCHFIDDQSH